ncbi:MAG: hypothetical protein AB1630_11915 [bacterium]
MMQIVFFLFLGTIFCGCNNPKSPLDIIPKLPILIDIGDKEKIVFCWGKDLYAIDPNEPAEVDPDKPCRANPNENTAELILPSPYDEAFPKWLPDGKRLVFSSMSQFGEIKFYMMDFNKKKVFDMGKMCKKLLKYGLYDKPRWSLECKKIVFSGRDGIYIADANGNNIKKAVDIPESGGVTNSISFSPDLRRILFDFWDSKDKSKGGIYTVEIATGRWKRLTYDNIIIARNPNYSPDGSKIVFEGSLYGEKKWKKIYMCRRICIMDADGKNLHRLTKDDNSERITEFNPSWSPDSKKVVFTGVFTDFERINLKEEDFILKEIKKWELFIVDVETGNIKRLTYSGKTPSHSPSWRPHPKSLKKE